MISTRLAPHQLSARRSALGQQAGLLLAPWSADEMVVCDGMTDLECGLGSTALAVAATIEKTCSSLTEKSVSSIRE